MTRGLSELAFSPTGRAPSPDGMGSVPTWCHWFQYRDQPLLGRGDGEAYEIGFVDVCDRPYPELTRAARAIGETMYDKRRNGVW